MADDSNLHPGALHWFSSDEQEAGGPYGWRLDVVTLLAVIGESSIADHSQAITASMLCLLPRIIPAPQALLKGTRPSRMPETAAKLTGIYSGVSLESVGFFANILHPLDEFSPFGFKVLKISHKDQNEAGDFEVPMSPTTDGNKLGRLFGKRTNTNDSEGRPAVKTNRIPGPPGSGSDSTANGVSRRTGVSFHNNGDPEAQAPVPGIKRRQTVKDRMTDYINNPTLATTNKRPAVPAALWSPIHVLSVFSMLLTFIIIGFSATDQDGTAILSLVLISLASSIVGAASWWRPILMKRSHTNIVPDGDVAIRTREGAFLIIKCTDNVARELYTGTEECEYRVNGQWYKVLMGLGTFTLMASVILLGNCKWKSQLFIGCAYISLNGMYWILGLLPKKYFWDLSRYNIEDITPKDAKDAHKTTDENDPREGVKSFTRTLWWCIRETKRTGWVERSGAAPSTPQWKQWLIEAEQAAEAGNRSWPSIARKDELMKMTDSEIQLEKLKKSPADREAKLDPAEQAVPAQMVQVSDTKREPGAF
ncbi:hypothetical protein BKA67DRAFT_594743 [Truncatella angustata]|uniref:Uncharacterized protein n=1 Tax=Truncatella angustata TaxID=152316 RepID=A0A9P8UCU8_9PEZI|nr:uncharacterized protein BKA67DRAFT_594743 [Truncatella angustata]KAH6647914.1 hypothetical protein BKA67DRAFT_594743 [Truncatella angustata]KAH8195439.1 hypothetical protein TruAng_010391 [Truncatella angustata]